MSPLVGAGIGGMSPLVGAGIGGISPVSESDEPVPESASVGLGIGGGSPVVVIDPFVVVVDPSVSVAPVLVALVVLGSSVSVGAGMGGGAVVMPVVVEPLVVSLELSSSEHAVPDSDSNSAPTAGRTKAGPRGGSVGLTFLEAILITLAAGRARCQSLQVTVAACLWVWRDPRKKGRSRSTGPFAAARQQAAT